MSWMEKIQGITNIKLHFQKHLVNTKFSFQNPFLNHLTTTLQRKTNLDQHRVHFFKTNKKHLKISNYFSKKMKKEHGVFHELPRVRIQDVVIDHPSSLSPKNIFNTSNSFLAPCDHNSSHKRNIFRLERMQNKASSTHVWVR